MEKKEYKIGEVFQFGRIKLKCEKYKNKKSPCFGCTFEHCNCLYAQYFTGPCQDSIREDKTDVIFVEVKDKE